MARAKRKHLGAPPAANDCYSEVCDAAERDDGVLLRYLSVTPSSATTKLETRRPSLQEPGLKTT